jgi:hypothetical protein
MLRIDKSTQTKPRLAPNLYTVPRIGYTRTLRERRNSYRQTAKRCLSRTHRKLPRKVHMHKHAGSASRSKKFKTCRRGKCAGSPSMDERAGGFVVDDGRRQRWARPGEGQARLPGLASKGGTVRNLRLTARLTPSARPTRPSAGAPLACPQFPSRRPLFLFPSQPLHSPLRT